MPTPPVLRVDRLRVPSAPPPFLCARARGRCPRALALVSLLVSLLPPAYSSSSNLALMLVFVLITTTHSLGVGLLSQPVQATAADPGAEVALRVTLAPAFSFGE